MTPEKEKKLQRILQILTAVTFVFMISMAVSFVDFRPFASLFQNDESALPDSNVPAELPELASVPKKGVKRAVAPPLQTPAKSPTPETPSKNSPETIEIKGDEAFAAKDFQKAETQFELARAVADTPMLRLKYLRSLLAQRKILEGQTFLNNYSDDKSVGMNMYRGILLALLNKPEESEAILKELAEIKTEGPVDLWFLEKAKPVVRAFAEWRFTTDAKAEHLQVLLAKAFDEIGEYGLSIEMALQAIKTRDDYRDAWVVLGHAYLAYEKFSDAASAFQKALSLDSEHAQTHFYLAFAKRGLSKWNEAYEALENAAKFGIPRNTFFQESEAAVLYELKRYEEALPLYLKVLETKAGNAQPQEYIRPLYLLLDVFEKKQEGLKLAKKALASHPNQPMSYNLVGWANLSIGNFAESSKQLNEAIRRDPTVPAFSYNLARLAERENRPEEARTLYEKALSLAIAQGDVSIANAARNRLEKWTIQKP